ncbi:hypothetical protein [Paenibacillus montanisoli]|nr:hypothetical protein [Paenibacillus montanisoli]
MAITITACTNKQYGANSTPKEQQRIVSNEMAGLSQQAGVPQQIEANRNTVTDIEAKVSKALADIDALKKENVTLKARLTEIESSSSLPSPKPNPALKMNVDPVLTRHGYGESVKIEDDGKNGKILIFLPTEAEIQKLNRDGNSLADIKPILEKNYPTSKYFDWEATDAMKLGEDYAVIFMNSHVSPELNKKTEEIETAIKNKGFLFAGVYFDPASKYVEISNFNPIPDDVAKVEQAISKCFGGKTVKYLGTARGRDHFYVED